MICGNEVKMGSKLDFSFTLGLFLAKVKLLLELLLDFLLTLLGLVVVESNCQSEPLDMQLLRFCQYASK